MIFSMCIALCETLMVPADGLIFGTKHDKTIANQNICPSKRVLHLY
jgi:hypothetical protein